jgi:sulfur carrier protein ThiS adenylyltransferase
LALADSASRQQYPQTLFTNQEAYAGSCTAKATIYCANVAAGLMLSQFAKWLRGLATDFDCQMNLLSAELTVAEAGT